VDALSEGIHLIIVHDKSDDSTQSELDEMIAQFDSNLILLKEVSFKSPGLTRNHGMEFISTPWFAFADADDYVEVENLHRLQIETERSMCHIGIGAFYSIDVKSSKTYWATPPNAGNAHLSHHLATTMGLWRFVFSTKECAKFRFGAYRMAEDYLFLAKLLDLNVNIYTNSMPVYTYYFGGDLNLTSNQSAMVDMYRVLRIFKTLKCNQQIAEEFRIYSLEKLAFSVIKNVKTPSLLKILPTLILIMISHPKHALRVLNGKAKNRGDLI